MNEAPLVLVCDHRGEGTGERWLRALGSGHRQRQSRSLRESLDLLERERPDLILLDPLAQGGSIELEAIDRARGAGDSRPVPLLLVADRDSIRAPEVAARALSRGPWDLIWRTAGAEELRMRLGLLDNHRRLLAEMEVLRHRASHDDRTDLLRPRAFEARLGEHFSAAQRHGLDLALVLVDLDDFGRVNKEHDHTVGDEVIARVGKVIHANLRAEDVAARLGGDEFSILLPYTKKLDVVAVVGRLREEIHALSQKPIRLEGVQAQQTPEVRVSVSASLGFETFDGSDLESVAALRAHAESALRNAKRAGGNRAVYFRGLESEESVTG